MVNELQYFAQNTLHECNQDSIIGYISKGYLLVVYKFCNLGVGIWMCSMASILLGCKDNLQESCYIYDCRIDIVIYTIKIYNSSCMKRREDRNSCSEKCCKLTVSIKATSKICSIYREF